MREITFGDIDDCVLAVAQHGHLLGHDQVIEVIHVVHVLQFVAVGLHGNVAIPKAQFLGSLAEVHTQGDFLKRNDMFALSVHET